MRSTTKSFLLICLFLASLTASHAQEEKYIGLFIYNFTKYFDWPENSKTGDFIVEVIGHESVGVELTKLTNGKRIGNQAISIKNIKTVKEMSGKAHMVFLGHWQSRFIPEVKEKTQNKPVLLISEMEGMLDKGSAINFVIRDGSIQFEMNASNVAASKIKTDQRIRELAYRVVN